MTKIPLSKIDLKDRRFSISYPPRDEKLLWSIGSIGIIQPVVLLDRTPFVPVAGLRRLQCARSLRLRTVEAVIMNPSDREALLISIHDNLSRELNIVEKALAIGKMDLFGLSEKEIFDVMEHMGLQPHKKVLSGFLAIAGSDEAFKDLVLEKNLSFRNIDSLIRFDERERAKIVGRLKGLHLTESTLREILEMLHLLKIRKGSITAADIPRSENADTLRAHLKRKTHPILTSLQKKLKVIREAMALPPGVDIKVDPFFEKEYIDIILKICNEEDVVKALAGISGLLRAGYVRSILELTKGRVR